ncbi:MAG: hypothetical protein WBC44_01225 [Planctomycetaceae bacterium]
MSETQRETPREFLERWQRVGPELERIRRRELRAYDFEKNRGAIASLFQLGTDRRMQRKSSGLVEWYRRLGLGR